jgi:hypothetical protein
LKLHHLPALVISLLCLVPAPLRPDAIMVTKAMTATTIAEVFVEEGSVRVELEIGVPDLETFRDLLPDPIYERLGHEPLPLEERL